MSALPPGDPKDSAEIFAAAFFNVIKDRLQLHTTAISQSGGKVVFQTMLTYVDPDNPNHPALVCTDTCSVTFAPHIPTISTGK